MRPLVGSVSNAIAILRHLATEKPEGVNAIARALGLSPSSCFNILKTLVAEGFVDFNAATKAYSLGDAPRRLFRPQPDLAAWIAWLRGELDRIAAAYASCCGLWRIEGKRLILIEAAESSLNTRIHLTVGQRLPIYLGAMGRCIAAYEGLSTRKIDAAIAALRWESRPSAQRYRRDMEAVKTKGWSVDDGHYLKGVVTIAAPILDNQKRAVTHCLTSTAFSGQHSAQKVAEVGNRIADLAKAAEARLHKLSIHS